MYFWILQNNANFKFLKQLQFTVQTQSKSEGQGDDCYLFRNIMDCHRPEFAVCDAILVSVLHFLPDEGTLDTSAAQNRKLTSMTFISICWKKYFRFKTNQRNLKTFGEEQIENLMLFLQKRSSFILHGERDVNPRLCHYYETYLKQSHLVFPVRQDPSSGDSCGITGCLERDNLVMQIMVLRCVTTPRWK